MPYGVDMDGETESCVQNKCSTGALWNVARLALNLYTRFQIQKYEDKLRFKTHKIS